MIQYTSIVTSMWHCNLNIAPLYGREVRTMFPQIPAGEPISFQTKELDVCNRELANVPQHWADIIPLIKIVTNELQAGSNVESMTIKILIICIWSYHTILDRTVLIYFKVLYASSERHVRAPVYTRLQIIVETFLETKLVNLDETSFTCRAWILNGDESVQAKNLNEGDYLNVIISLRGEKPVIYLFTPEVIDVFVKSSLIPQWNLSNDTCETLVPRDEWGSLVACSHPSKWRVDRNPQQVSMLHICFGKLSEFVVYPSLIFLYEHGLNLYFTPVRFSHRFSKWNGRGFQS